MTQSKCFSPVRPQFGFPTNLSVARDCCCQWAYKNYVIGEMDENGIDIGTIPGSNPIASETFRRESAHIDPFTGPQRSPKAPTRRR